MQDIEDIANETQPLYLTDDQGKAYGFWVIEKFSVLGKFFRYGQEAPIKNAWTLEIKYHGENGDRPVDATVRVRRSNVQSIENKKTFVESLDALETTATETFR